MQRQICGCSPSKTLMLPVCAGCASKLEESAPSASTNNRSDEIASDMEAWADNMTDGMADGLREQLRVWSSQLRTVR